MSLYELTYILRSDLEEEAVQAVQDRIAGRINDAEGEVVKSEGWGRRRFAYPIERVREGFYYTSILRMPSNQVRSLESQLRLVPEVLRFLMISQDEKNINLNGSLIPSMHRPAPAAPAAPAESVSVGETPASETASSAPESEAPEAAESATATSRESVAAASPEPGDTSPVGAAEAAQPEPEGESAEEASAVEAAETPAAEGAEHDVEVAEPTPNPDSEMEAVEPSGEAASATALDTPDENPDDQDTEPGSDADGSNT